MPKIETLSSGVAQIESKATASALFDKTGMDSLSDELGEVSDTLSQMAVDEQKIQAARVLSEARQQWMFDFDKRKTEAETNGTYQGFTQSFQKDYRAWMPNAVKGIRNKDVAAKLELGLMDLETSFLGDAISYESSQRGKILKENYERSISVPIIEMNSSRDIGGLNSAIIGADNIVEMLPDGEIKEGAKKTVKTAKYQNAIRLSVDDLENFDPLMESLKSDETLDGDTKIALGNMLVTTQEAGYNKLATSVEEDLAWHEMNAEKGALDPSWIVGVNDKIRKLPPDSDERKKLEERVIRTAELNQNIRQMSDMSDGDFNNLLLQKASKAVDKEGELSVERLAQARIKYKENLSKDFAGTVMAQSPMARTAYENYSKSLSDNSDVGVKNQKQAFDVYASYLETKADKLGISRSNINYITQNEATALVDDIKGSLKQTNGNIQVSSIIDNMAVSQGIRFYNTLKQITDLDKELLPLGALPRVTGGDKRSQVIKNNIIEALSIKLSTPEAFNIKSADGKKVEVLPVTTEKAIAFEDNNLSFDNNSRKAAYELLYMNEYRKTGKAPSVKDLEETVYGDISVQLYEDRKILYPAQYQSSISGMMKNAERMIEKNKSTLNLLENALEIDEDYVNDRPLDYITFKSSSGADGVMAIWNGTDGQPVKNKKGEDVIYSWKQLEIMSK